MAPKEVMSSSPFSSFPPPLKRGEIPGIELVCRSGSRLECVSGGPPSFGSKRGGEAETRPNVGPARDRHAAAVHRARRFLTEPKAGSPAPGGLSSQAAPVPFFTEFGFGLKIFLKYFHPSKNEGLSRIFKH